MIVIRNLSIDLGEFSLRDVDLTIHEGEYVVLLGPTGAGKTVLIECIAGIHRQRQGTISIDGTEVTELYPEERGVGYVPQDYALFPNMTVEENLAYGLEAHAVPPAERRTRCEEMMEDLGIRHLRKRHPLNLSGGERQRVALGRALVTRPRILLLDEPLSALDENLRGDLAAELRRVQQRRGGTFLHVCHSFEEAAEVADRIAIMHAGRIAQVGSIEDVVGAPRNGFVARFGRARNLWRLSVTSENEDRSRILLGGELALELPTRDLTAAMERSGTSFRRDRPAKEAEGDDPGPEARPCDRPDGRSENRDGHASDGKTQSRYGHASDGKTENRYGHASDGKTDAYPLLACLRPESIRLHRNGEAGGCCDFLDGADDAACFRVVRTIRKLTHHEIHCEGPGGHVVLHERRGERALDIDEVVRLSCDPRDLIILPEA